MLAIARSLFAGAAFAVAGWFVYANLQPGESRYLGEVVSHKMFRKVQVFGKSYGWPFVYETKADRIRGFETSSFDECRYSYLFTNAMFGVAAFLFVLVLGHGLIGLNHERKTRSESA